MVCHTIACIKRIFYKGSMVIVGLTCQNQHNTEWSSQPNIKGMGSGNLHLAAGILFSGNTFQKVKDFMDICKIPFISQVTFNSIQKRFLFPAIHRVFTTNRTLLLESAKENNELHLLGDGRCDSPGYSAKLGTP